MAAFRWRHQLMPRLQRAPVKLQRRLMSGPHRSLVRERLQMERRQQLTRLQRHPRAPETSTPQGSGTADDAVEAGAGGAPAGSNGTSN